MGCIGKQACAPSDQCDQELDEGDQQHTRRRDLHGAQANLVVIEVGLNAPMRVPMPAMAMIVAVFIVVVLMVSVFMRLLVVLVSR
jgi:hypothetical protein